LKVEKNCIKIQNNEPLCGDTEFFHPRPEPMTELTLRQRQILNLIRRHIRDRGAPPTRAEIATELGFRSANAAEEHLRALARRGVIEIVRGTSRGIRLLGAEEEHLLPVVGRVAAGSPILAEEHIEDRHRLDPDLFRPEAHYLLRVRGESMRDAGILDGDLLAVHRTPEASNGQIVVARLEDEVTVKRFRRHNRWRHRVQLLPENPDFAPIQVDLREQELVIEGLGVGVLRLGLGRVQPL
jgi:repressor LexA